MGYNICAAHWCNLRYEILETNGISFVLNDNYQKNVFTKNKGTYTLIIHISHNTDICIF